MDTKDRMTIVNALDIDPQIMVTLLEGKIDTLLDALRAADNLLHTMTTSEYSRGEDAPVRKQIAEAIRKATE